MKSRKIGFFLKMCNVNGGKKFLRERAGGIAVGASLLNAYLECN